MKQRCPHGAPISHSFTSARKAQCEIPTRPAPGCDCFWGGAGWCITVFKCHQVMQMGTGIEPKSPESQPPLSLWQGESLTHAGAVVAGQLEAWLTLAGEGAWGVDAAMLAVPVPALVDVCHTGEKGLNSLSSTPSLLSAAQRPRWPVPTHPHTRSQSCGSRQGTCSGRRRPC